LGRERAPANGSSAIVQLLKVLLQNASEKHQTASKMIATVDELEEIATSEDADVPALKGWRREMFGNLALELKAGRLSIAIENGRIVTRAVTIGD
jgi:ribonuclease D